MLSMKTLENWLNQKANIEMIENNRLEKVQLVKSKSFSVLVFEAVYNICNENWSDGDEVILRRILAIKFPLYIMDETWKSLDANSSWIRQKNWTFNFNGVALSVGMCACVNELCSDWKTVRVDICLSVIFYLTLRNKRKVILKLDYSIPWTRDAMRSF